jgi:metal-responsive CopG/Arc/MetJ family transcriptional regulator
MKKDISKNSVTTQSETAKSATVKAKNDVIDPNEKYALTVSVSRKLVDEVTRVFAEDNCASRSEFIEKAVNFYLGYLSQNKNVSFLSPMIINTIKANMSGTEERLARLLFKIAVELGKVSNITAAMNGVDSDTLHKLHTHCIEEVRHLNGIINFDDAVKFQRG